MAIVKPLRGLRFTPKAGDLAELVCPPYDIISEEERKAYIACNSHNLIRLELPRGERPEDDRYATAGTLLGQWLEEGILAVDDRPGLYIYEEEFTALGATHRVKGFHCAVQLEEFDKGVVLPHEETLSKAKTDRFNLMKACGCNFSPIYSLYFDEDNTVRPLIDQLSAGQPTQQITTTDGVIHRLWCIYDSEALTTVTAAFADKKIYIADGHHRYETALNYRNWLREQGGDAPDVMMTLVNMEHEGLVVFPTHRIVRDLPSFDMDKALEACARYFEVKPLSGDIAQIQGALDARYGAGDNSFVLYDGRGAWELTLTDKAAMASLYPDHSAAYHGLDVSILHSLVLERCFGIDKENMANQKNLTYTRDAGEAMEAVDGGKANCAVLLNPTRVEQIAAVASAGDKMPQKSTYFYPKIITGTVMNKLK